MLIRETWENSKKALIYGLKTNFSVIIIPVFFATLIPMAGCAVLPGKKANTSVIDDGLSHIECLVFKPIFWSKKDTKNTTSQISDHNAVWDALCNPEISRVVKGKTPVG